MKDIVYVVKSYSGSYDDLNWWIEGIFEKEQDAIDCKDTILKEIKDIIDSKNPIEGCEDYETLPKNVSDEDYEKWGDWYWKRNKALGFNDCTILPYELNKRIKQ